MSLGFGLLDRQNKTFEDVTLGFWNDGHFLPFSDIFILFNEERNLQFINNENKLQLYNRWILLKN